MANAGRGKTTKFNNLGIAATGDSCEWDTPSGDRLYLNVYSGIPISKLESQAHAGGAATTTVDGVGDSAFQSEGAITAASGAKVFELLVYGTAPTVTVLIDAMRHVLKQG